MPSTASPFIAMIACASCGAAAIHRIDGTTIAPSQVDATVERLLHAAQVTGAAIAIFEHGEPTYARTYGTRDGTRPLTPDSVMTAASLTKAAFAYLVMQLVDAGQLDLDRPIHLYLPKSLAEFPRYADLAGDARADRLTARMLLDHTSGFANWRWLEDDRKLTFHFDPGTRFAYSGEGIDLLQLVVETITHTPVEQLMQDRVFTPLHMTRSSMVWQPRFEDDHAIGFDEYARSLGEQRRTRADAAGSMQTTVADYARLVSAVMRATGLRPATRDEMLRPQIQISSLHEFPTLRPETTDANRAIELAYGLGWGVYHTAHGRAFFKEGHDEGWRHYVVGFDDGSGLLIMTNSNNGEGIYKELVETLLGNRDTPIEWEGFTPYDKLPPRAPPPAHHRVAIAPTRLDSYAGRYVLRDLTLTIRRSGDHLTIQDNDETPQDLLPEGDREFYSTTSTDTLTFVVDATGAVTALVLHVGKDIEVPRAP